MRRPDGKYECSHCGAILDLLPSSAPQVEIRAASGQPNRRYLMIDGEQLHSCEIGAEAGRRRELLRKA